MMTLSEYQVRGALNGLQPGQLVYMTSGQYLRFAAGSNITYLNSIPLFFNTIDFIWSEMIRCIECNFQVQIHHMHLTSYT